MIIIKKCTMKMYRRQATADELANMAIDAYRVCGADLFEMPDGTAVCRLHQSVTQNSAALTSRFTTANAPWQATKINGR